MSIPRQRFVTAPHGGHRQRLMTAALALTLIVAVGCFGFMRIEGWSVIQSVFFTLITLTTIGYSDYELSELGKVFSLGLMIGGLAVVTYAAGQLLPFLFNHQLSWERRMNNRILKLKDHFIVCGAGRIGLAVCRHLARTGVPFVAIDPDPKRVSVVVEADHLALLGDATQDDVLEEAGIDQAQAIACVTGSDSENIVITLSARERKPDLTIVARAENEDAIPKLRRAGATRVISPILSGGLNIVNAILKPNLAEFLDLSLDRDADFELAEIAIQPGSNLDGTRVCEQFTAHDGVTFIAMKRAQRIMRLHAASQETLAAGDVLIIAGNLLAIDAFQREATSNLQAA